MAWLLLAVGLLVGASCSSAPSGPPVDEGAAAPVATGSETSEASDRPGPTDDSGRGQRSDLASRIVELPPAPTGLPTPGADARRPVGLTIESLGIDTATVRGVGVEDNGEMEVPPADEIGWYRYGPSPGEEGAAVLAAHIAYEGVNGVFVDLDDLEPGARIDVHYDDGTTTRFVARSTEQYGKSELPRDDVWGRRGPSSLVLITCGGDFNSNLRSYEDNVVVFATLDEAG